MIFKAVVTQQNLWYFDITFLHFADNKYTSMKIVGTISTISGVCPLGLKRLNYCDQRELPTTKQRCMSVLGAKIKWVAARQLFVVGTSLVYPHK